MAPPCLGGLPSPGCGTSRVTAGIAAALIQPKPILAQLNFFQPFADGRGRDALESAVLCGERDVRVPAVSCPGTSGAGGHRRMVSPGGVIIILIFIFILLLLLLLWGSERDPGAASGKGSGGSGRTREAPYGPESLGLRAGPEGSQVPPEPGSGRMSKAKPQKAGRWESCCAEGPRCCRGWVGLFGRALGRAVRRGSLGFGSFPLLRVFPSASVRGKAGALLWLEFSALEVTAPWVLHGLRGSGVRGDSPGGWRPPQCPWDQGQGQLYLHPVRRGSKFTGM